MSVNAKQLVPGFRFGTDVNTFTVVREWRAENGRVWFVIRRAEGIEFNISRVSLLRDKRLSAAA